MKTYRMYVQITDTLNGFITLFNLKIKYNLLVNFGFAY